MNGEWLGSRAIRVNWANQKTQTGGRGGPSGFGGGGPSSGGGIGGGGGGPSYGGGMSGLPATPAPYGGAPTGMAGGMAMGMAAGGGFSGGGNDYETVVAQTPAYNTTVYVGNLIPYSTQADLIPLFQVRGPSNA